MCTHVFSLQNILPNQKMLTVQVVKNSALMTKTKCQKGIIDETKEVIIAFFDNIFEKDMKNLTNKNWKGLTITNFAKSRIILYS